jgi:hypothetical protein
MSFVNTPDLICFGTICDKFIGVSTILKYYLLIQSVFTNVIKKY